MCGTRDHMWFLIRLTWCRSCVMDLYITPVIGDVLRTTWLLTNWRQWNVLQSCSWQKKWLYIQLIPDCTIITLYNNYSTIFATVSGILAFINCWDVKWATRVQDVFTYAKLLALFVIIFTGAYQLCNGKFIINNNYIGKIKFRTCDNS